MAKKTTLRDIAQQADVALSTVSQVLNNKSGVSAELRKHVLEVASELGYRQKITVDTPLGAGLEVVSSGRLGTCYFWHVASPELIVLCI